MQGGYVTFAQGGVGCGVVEWGLLVVEESVDPDPERVELVAHQPNYSNWQPHPADLGMRDIP